MKKLLSSLFCMLVITVFSYAGTIIDVTNFGARPDSGQDAMTAVRKAIAACKGKSDPVLFFPKGRYDFFPKTSPIGLEIKGLKNIVVEGNGSEIVYHGTMKVALIDNCEQVTIRNLSVDWDRPFLSQGEIVKVSSSYIDVRFDKQQYPYVIEKNKLLFVGENWKYPVLTYFTNLYEKKSREFMYNTWDAPLGDIFEKKAVERKKGIVRFYGSVPMKPAKGSIIAMRSMKDYLFGFDVENSRNVTFQNIRVYHCMSHAFFGKHTENITLDNAFAEARKEKGRVFSSACDAAHFMNCKGLIKVVNCAPTGNGDDFLNVHGRYFQILRLVDKKTVEVKSTDVEILKDEDMWIVDKNTMKRGTVLHVSSVTSNTGNKDNASFRVIFDKAIPSTLKVGDCLESKTWTAAVEVRNCRMLKTNRGHGVLVATPQNVVIEDNYFNTVGAAIKMAGDMSFWFESGSNGNVTIRNNVFENCLTSGQAPRNVGKWGNAVITMMPSLEPTNSQTATFHNNIIIENNTFKVFDAPILYARSVGSIRFTGNRIQQTSAYQPYTWQRTAFLLDGCKNVSIEGNIWDEKFTARKVQVQHMNVSDVSCSDQRFGIQR